MAKKKIKKKSKKVAKVFHLEWVFEPFMEDPSFYKKRMFGGLAAYCHDRMMYCLVESPGDTTWRGKDYGKDIWNGVLICMEWEHHTWMLENFPSLESHLVLDKWLYLPVTVPDFESTVLEISELIAENDHRIGIYSKSSLGPKKKKTKKKTTKKTSARSRSRA